MKKIIGALVVIAAILAVVGCQQPAPKEWDIPFLNSLTGPIASIGAYLEWGADQAAKEINAAGGINGKPVKIIPVDTGMDPQKGSTEMARLVKNTLVALGPVPEPVIMAAMPIAVEAGMPSITATTSLEYAQKFFPWTISWFPSTKDRLAPLVAAWAKQFPDMKKVVQFVENYGPWPGMADAHAAGLDGRWVIQVLRPGGGSQRRGYLRPARRQGPEREAGRDRVRLQPGLRGQADQGAEKPRLEEDGPPAPVQQRGRP